MTTAFTTRELDAYAAAGSVAQEVLSSIKTVIAFGGMEKETRRYTDNLQGAYKMGIKKGVVQGLGMAAMFFFDFASYALAFW